jgi:hypothetical protein
MIWRARLSSPPAPAMGFMILTLEFLPTQHNVVKYWKDVFSRLVRTPAWKKYLSDNQFKDAI